MRVISGWAGRSPAEASQSCKGSIRFVFRNLLDWLPTLTFILILHCCHLLLMFSALVAGHPIYDVVG